MTLKRGGSYFANERQASALAPDAGPGVNRNRNGGGLPLKDDMNLETINTVRPRLSLQFGRMNRPSPERPQLDAGVLPAHELQRIVSEMVG
jgi:hypothetical protein